MNEVAMGTVPVITPAEIRHGFLNQAILIFNEKVRNIDLKYARQVECYFDSFEPTIIEDLIAHIESAGWDVEVYRDVESPYFTVTV